MEITFAAVYADDENRHSLNIKADEDETIRVGQTISIMLTDQSCIQREIASMRRWELKPGAKRGKWIDVDSISNGESGEIDVYGIEGHVQTTSMPSPEEMERIQKMINIMPYKEINGGEESIFDHIDEDYVVPEKVIRYLQTTKPFCVCMGIYRHPFKDMTLLGPYYYTDDEYYWDRDTWKYVLKYHVTLPRDFVEKVMSEAGTAFLESCAESDASWAKCIKELKKRPHTLCFMPADAGDYPLDDF